MIKYAEIYRVIKKVYTRITVQLYRVMFDGTSYTISVM
jgi:hypothetical protein